MVILRLLAQDGGSHLPRDIQKLLCVSQHPLSIARMKGSHKMAIDKYFDILEDTLTENDLYAFPHQIFNMDETGMSLDCKPLKTIHRRGAKNPTHIPGTTKSNVTVVACAGADGQCLPPMVIWKGK